MSEYIPDLSPILGAVPAAPKLTEALLFFINRLPEKMNRITVCKHLFYADGHYFQKTGERITEFPYLHIEGSPQPLFFNEILNRLTAAGEIRVNPKLQTEIINGNPVQVLKGFVYSAGRCAQEQIFHREELKVLKSVASQLNGELALETRYYPNLFQMYAQTELYGPIPFMRFKEGKRPHLSWKAWAGKVFRLLME